jgi:hypothetical protein
MMKQRLLVRAKQFFVIPFGCLLWSAQGLADSAYQLDLKTAVIGVTSTKNDLIKERHEIKFKSGSVSSTGEVALVVDLRTTETNIPIRNERMLQHLFAQSPLATVSAQLPPEVFAKARAGKAISEPVVVTLVANGVSQTRSIEMALARDAMGDLVVSGQAEIDVSEFGYGPGIETLRSLAGLLSISTLVPVDFVLPFND